MPDAIFFDGRTAAGQPAGAILTTDQLAITRATDGAALASWPLATLARSDLGGPADSATFRSGRGAERLQVLDPTLLAALGRAGKLGAGSAGWRPRIWLSMAVGLCASLAVAALLIDRIPDLLLPLVPRAIERGWSTGIETVVAAGSRRCTGPGGETALAGLMVRLSEGAGIDPPALTVLDNPLVNAFTLPDGRVILLRGLIDRASGPDELSGVLAHELGHVRRRDPTREMLRRLEVNMLARSVGWGGNVAGQMTALSYGRRAEAAADASALATLRHARPARRRACPVLHRVAAVPAATGGLPAFLSGHPADAARAAALQAGAEGEPAMLPGAWKAVRSMCAE